MGFKEAISRFIEKKRERDAYLKELQKRQRAEKIVEERQKSANERELSRFLDERRERLMKEQLNIERKMRAKEVLLNDPTNVPSIFHEGDSLVTKNIFDHSHSIQQRNLFG